MTQRYEVTHIQHYIGGRLRQPGEVVTLPDGVTPGRHLVKVGGAAAVEPVAPEAGPGYSIKHHFQGSWKVVDRNGDQVGEVFAAHLGDKEAAKEAAQTEANRLNGVSEQTPEEVDPNLPDA